MALKRLEKYVAIAKEIKQLRGMLAELETGVYTLQMAKLTGMPRGTVTKRESKQEALSDATEALRRKYAAKIEELRHEQLAIERDVEALEPEERRLVRMRYIEGKSAARIAREEHYSRSAVYKIIQRGCRKIEPEE